MTTSDFSRLLSLHRPLLLPPSPRAILHADVLIVVLSRLLLTILFFQVCSPGHHAALNSCWSRILPFFSCHTHILHYLRFYLLLTTIAPTAPLPIARTRNVITLITIRFTLERFPRHSEPGTHHRWPRRIDWTDVMHDRRSVEPMFNRKCNAMHTQPHTYAYIKKKISPR